MISPQPNVALSTFLLLPPPFWHRNHVGEISGFEDQRGEANQTEVLGRCLEELCLPRLPGNQPERRPCFLKGWGGRHGAQLAWSPRQRGTFREARMCWAGRLGTARAQPCMHFVSSMSSPCRKVVACVLTSCLCVWCFTWFTKGGAHLFLSTDVQESPHDEWQRNQHRGCREPWPWWQP